MKLRIFTRIVLVLLLAVLTGVTALADVIWEPNDSFYHREFEDCTYNGRSYTANGPDGTVAVLKEPGSKTAVASVSNGSVLYVSFTYADKAGDVWGVVAFTLDAAGNAAPSYTGDSLTGWLRMKDMELVYDYISFSEDHQKEFTPYTGTYEEFRVSGELVFWTYPGSGVVAARDEAPSPDQNFNLDVTYTDADGRQWGFVSYFYGLKNVWICISDPTGAALEVSPSQVTMSPAPSSPAVSPTVASPTVALPPAVPKDQAPTLLLIIGLVFAVVVVTGVLIAVFWNKSRKSKAVK